MRFAVAAVVCVGTAGVVAGSAEASPYRRGMVVGVSRLTNAAALPAAAVNRKIVYTSVGVGGRPIVVTGTVAVPKGAAPRGGWPVVSWAHGTTGTGDACAPSADTVSGPAHDYLSVTESYLNKWVANGYVVVQTDYEGLGTRGGHPYMNGASEANTVLDIVRAARGVDRRIGRDWFVAGHSQGGQAALYTAAGQGQRHVWLRGAVAIAPGSNMSQTVLYIKNQYPGAEVALPFLFVLVNGAHAADPSIVPEDLLTDEAAAVARAGRADACLAQLRELSANLPLSNVFRPGADLTRFERYYDAQEALGLTLTVPTLVAQGTADTSVTPAATKNIVDDLCERYPNVTYRTFDGADHRGSIDASFATSLAFVQSLRTGHIPVPTC